MSRTISYDYEYERERRRTLYLERVRSTTSEFYSRYSSQYQDMQSQGFQQYIPSEMAQLSSDLSRMSYLLSSDPEQAREVSREIGSYIRTMWSLGRSAGRQFRENERQEAARQRAEERRAFERQLEEQRRAAEAADRARLEHVAELNQAYYQITEAISDRIVANLAAPQFEELKKEVRNSNSGLTIEQLKKRASEILEEAEKQAKEWKKNTAVSQKKQIHAERIAEAKEQLAAGKMQDQKKAAELLHKLDALQASAESDTAFEEELHKIEDAVDETLISEEVRRETVRAICQQLMSQEFLVDTPQQLKEGDEDYVLITAHRPSGNRVICKIDLHGKLMYQFDQYEGSTCLKDIERFNVDLQQIYSIHLSDERVLWRNPDRLDKDATQTSNPNSGGMNSGS